MAINSYDKQSDKVISSSATKSICSKSSHLSVCHLMKLDYTADDSNTSSNCKHEESKKKNNASPYLTDDKIQMLSRITEKRLVRKKTNNFISSLPLAVNVYKASSDELKFAKKRDKKVKKSVLTLPNEPALLPQACTVSDMNDSEYFNENKDEHKQKATKRRPIEITRKPRNKSKGIEVLNSVRYCAQRNIDFDSSSTDTINCFTGDGKKVSNKSQKNIKCNSSTNAHNVWTLLRNMNRFQFKPSPPLSLNSTESIKNTKNYNKRRNGQMDTKFIETCRTEEFTYISSLIDNTPRNSQSSIDRITVIDKQDDYRGVSEELKVVKHKMTTKEKGQKKFKPYIKNKLNIRTKQNSGLAVCDGRYNDELNRLSNVNHKLEENCHNKNCHNSVNDSKNESHYFNDREDRISLGENSGASGNIIKNISDITDPNKFDKLSPSDSQCQINGITKVVLSKGQNDFLTKKAESLKRKPRLGNTMASGAVCPKLTQTEIKRRLAKIKFPVVILAKDQVCATFHVTDYEPPQFAGLDEQIWPFMQNWINKGFSKGFVNYNEANKCVNKINVPGMKRDCIEKYNSGLKNKSIINGNNYSKNKIKNYIPLKDKNATQQVPKIEYINNKVPNIKPMRQFKNRMLQFLYKKQPFNGRNNNCYALDVTNQKDVSCCLVDVGTNTPRNLVATEEDDTLSMKEGIKHSQSTMKQAWAKGRWASDFIDNVIKKIKGGVYYQDEKYFSKNHCSITKDDWVQTEMTLVKNDYCYNCNRKTSAIVAVNQSCDPLQLIPGFDNSLSGLQIELLNKNLIEIKHSITNIVVQFDIALPSQINRVLHLNQPVSCIPVTVTDSQTKIFKSKTTIVNAILPAELCSILPKLIRNIVDIRPTLPKIAEKVDSNLTPITEISRYESGDSIKQVIPIQINISPEPKRTVNITSQNSYKEVYSLTVTHLLPNIISNHQVDSTTLHSFESPQFESIKSESQMCFTEKALICQELQPHIIKDRQIVPDFRTYNFCDFAVVIMNNQSLHLNLNMTFLSAQFFKNNIIVKMAPDKEESSLLIAHVKIDSLFNDYQESINSSKNILNNLNLGLKNEMGISECPNRPRIKKIYNCKNNFEQCTNNNQNKRRSFIKLYKKCRSVSRISNERSAMALNKIKGLDDFFLALGSGKSLVSVVDGGAETKILMSIKEMKYWITSITPRQALLVLLLANKKDTSNLVRYRSVILQAIAVNRITCTSELDMEIEVIESENLNTFSKYEGISYLPASIENQDTLLEELHWIAKTTASDYQRTFDESSERLLKSLLEKRKKLNPSYLRVMARYVGLGLLKPTK